MNQTLFWSFILLLLINPGNDANPNWNLRRRKRRNEILAMDYSSTIPEGRCWQRSSRSTESESLITWKKSVCWHYVILLQMQSLKPSISSNWAAPDGWAEIKVSEISGRNPGDKILWVSTKWAELRSTYICFHFMSLFMSPQEYAIIHKSLIVTGIGSGQRA